jgi:hypothetical protein
MVHQMRQAARLMPVDGGGRVLLVGSVPLLHREAQTARCSMPGPTDLSRLGGADAFVACPVGRTTTEVLAGYYEPDEHGQRKPEPLYGSLNTHARAKTGWDSASPIPSSRSFT